ncbi:MAG TPA: hypothetical protein VN108_10915 [Marmoricola sp.]|nr:hypothetical protein [Marmoricola sp.]
MLSPHAMVIDRLCRRFPNLAESVVTATVLAIEETFADARIRDYIPLLVEREARDVLAHTVATAMPTLERV